MTAGSAPLVGIVGGLGPRASTAFVRTIYRRAQHRREQDQPRILLWSDPAMPDRSAALAAGRHRELAAGLEESLVGLERGGADLLVVCCMTAHAALPHVRHAVTRPILSLVDAAVAVAGRRRGPHLLACTTGTRRSGVLLDRLRAEGALDTVALPIEADQRRIHDLIYRLKRGGDPRAAAATLSDIAARYPVDGVLAACTELHLLSPAGLDRGLALLDPLDAVAARIAGGGTLVGAATDPSRARA